MTVLAQHGFGDSERIETGLSSGVIDGCILGPKDLTRSSLMTKIEMIRKTNAAAALYFDPQYYAVIVGNESGARLGNLASDYTEYFASKAYRDIRREKVIREEVSKVVEFQRDTIGLDRFILPGILIQNGLQSESASIAKSFVEVSEEIAAEQRISDRSWITLALGESCFRDMKGLENLVDEITGLGLQAKGIYLLVETSKLDGGSPWCHPNVLAGQMYLVYALNLAGFNVICGFSGLSAPYLSAVGASAVAFGWFDTLRFFSLDRFRPPQQAGGRRPRRKYLSRSLWSRVDLGILQTIGRTHPRILNGSPWDPAYMSGELEDRDEVLQHWHAVGSMEIDLASLANVEQRIGYLGRHLDGIEQTRASLVTIPFPGLQEQVAQTRLSLRRFQEVAELVLPEEDGHGFGVG